MEAVIYSETSVHSHQTVRHCMSQESNPQSPLPEAQTSRKNFCLFYY